MDPRLHLALLEQDYRHGARRRAGASNRDIGAHSCRYADVLGLYRRQLLAAPIGCRRTARIVVAMADDLDVEVIGGDPLVDGMTLSVRLRYDFTVTDAGRLLATARRLYRELNPDASPDGTEEMVTCAADALFVVLEHAGVFGAATDGRLAGYGADGLAACGRIAQAVINEPRPLSPHPLGNCLYGDPFALPSNDNDPQHVDHLGGAAGAGDNADAALGGH
jgi:hypothetical protein